MTTTRHMCRWIDAGKFLTGFSAVGSIAIPAILYHAQVMFGSASRLHAQLERTSC